MVKLDFLKVYKSAIENENYILTLKHNLRVIKQFFPIWNQFLPIFNGGVNVRLQCNNHAIPFKHVEHTRTQNTNAILWSMYVTPFHTIQSLKLCLTIYVMDISYVYRTIHIDSTKAAINNRNSYKVTCRIRLFFIISSSHWVDTEPSWWAEVHYLLTFQVSRYRILALCKCSDKTSSFTGSTSNEYIYFY